MQLQKWLTSSSRFVDCGLTDGVSYGRAPVLDRSSIARDADQAVNAWQWLSLRMKNVCKHLQALN